MIRVSKHYKIQIPSLVIHSVRLTYIRLTPRATPLQRYAWWRHLAFPPWTLTTLQRK